MRIGKLSRRLFLLTLIALIPATAVLFYNVHAIQAAKDLEIHEEALRTAQLASLEVQRIISGAENVLIALSAAPVVQAGDEIACKSYLRSVGARLPQFSGIAVTDKSGTIVCALREESMGLSLAERPYFAEASGQGHFVVGEYTIGRLSSKPTLPLALPIRNDKGEVSGVILGALSLDWLSQRLGERDFARKSALSIVDRGGTIIARMPIVKGYVGSKMTPQVAPLLHATEPGTKRIIGRDGVERMLGYYPLSSVVPGLFVGAGISTEEAYATIRRVGLIGLVTICASTLLSFLLAWFTSAELIRRPVGRLVSTIAAWRTGNEAARTDMSEASGEFGIVGKAIDDFLGELVAARQARAIAEERRELLVHELDHRIKNLMATVQSMARQTLKDSTQQDAVAAFSRRLGALGEAHGLLMKDDAQSAGMRELAVSAVRPFAGEETTQVSFAGPDFSVKAKAVLSLSMALHELCTNAFKYGALKTAEGRVRIEWTIAETEGKFSLLWTEEGGPPVEVPEKFGFGSKMIERMLGYELEADVETRYDETGVVFALTAPVQRVRVGRDGQA